MSCERTPSQPTDQRFAFHGLPSFFEARTVRVVRGVAVAFVVAAFVAAGSAGAGTIRIGIGIDDWKLGQKFRVAPGLVRTVRYRDNDGSSCRAGPATAQRIDYYRGGIRVAWHGTRGSSTSYLFDVATTRPGDKSGDGFVIGKATLAQVRARHPKAEVSRPEGALVLGKTLLGVRRITGYSTWTDFGYWFDARGKLVALETHAGRC